MIYKEVIFMEQDMMEALIMQKEKCKEKKRETFFHYAEKIGRASCRERV